jgi:hypothetical protein
MQEAHITHVTGWDFYTFLIVAPLLVIVIIFLGEKLISHWEKRHKRNK